jgi:hypothetical protein
VNDFTSPETRCALSGDVNIAYQTIGDGPIDLVVVPGVVSHLDFLHEFAGYTAFLHRLSQLLASSRLTKEGRACPTEFPARLRLSSEWMTCAR